MPRHKGFRVRSRDVLKRKRGERAGPKPEVYLTTYPVGTRVAVVLDPYTQKGAPHRRYQGKTGTIVERRGRGYIVAVKIGSKLKKLSLLPEHLKPLSEPKQVV